MAEQFVNEISPAITLTASIGPTDTTLTPSSVASLPATGTFRIRIDNEYMKASVNGSVLNITRGDDGSTATGHNTNANIYVIVTRAALNAINTIMQSGVEIANRRALNFINAIVVDDATNGKVDITIPPLSLGTFASRPSTPSGLYLATDDETLSINNAGTWNQFGPIFPTTPPPALASFGWINQGTATATQNATGGSIFLSDPSGSSDNIRVLTQTAPSTPYNLTIGMLAAWNYADTGSKMCGPCMVDSSTGKLVTWGLIFNSGTPSTAGINYNSPTSFSGNILRNVICEEPLFWRMRDDGTNISFYISRDGVNFVFQQSVGRHSFLTAGPDKVGFYINPHGGFGASMFSWKVG